MLNHDMQEDEFECNILAIKAEGIFGDLTKTARTAFRRGYGITQLIFSDWSFVSRTESGVISRVEALLRAGHKPLGFIAPDRDRNRNPFVEPWDKRNDAAIAELRYLAHSVYRHLLPERNANIAVRGNGGDHGK